MTPTISFLGETRCRLGESPLWEPDLQALFWVDAVGETVWRRDADTGRESRFPAPGVVGSIVRGAPGSLVVGAAGAIWRMDLADGRFEAILTLSDMGEHERLNDGKTDRQGRLVTGSLTHFGAEGAQGRLFRFDRGRAPEVLEREIAVSNSIAFSPSGDRMYFADSLRQRVWAYGYEGETGRIGPRIDLVDTAPLGSAPDGATVDAEGWLWVALVQAGKIARFEPDGRLDRLVETPIPFPSCPAFGGANLDVLYVTSISNSGGRLVTDHPDGGRVMAIKGLGAQGLVETRCRL